MIITTTQGKVELEKGKVVEVSYRARTLDGSITMFKYYDVTGISSDGSAVSIRHLTSGDEHIISTSQIKFVYSF